MLGPRRAGVRHVVARIKSCTLDGIDAVSVEVECEIGKGIPYFRIPANAPIKLDGPEITQGDGVTHLHYRVRR